MADATKKGLSGQEKPTFPGGYNGRILRVDLSKNSIKTESLDEMFCRKYLGGAGFIAYYLWKELKKEQALHLKSMAKRDLDSRTVPFPEVLSLLGSVSKPLFNLELLRGQLR